MAKRDKAEGRPSDELKGSSLAADDSTAVAQDGEVGGGGDEGVTGEAGASSSRTESTQDDGSGGSGDRGSGDSNAGDAGGAAAGGAGDFSGGSPAQPGAADRDQFGRDALARIDSQLELLRGPDGAVHVPEGRTLEDFIAEGVKARAELAALLGIEEKPAQLQRGDAVMVDGTRALRVLTADDVYVCGVTPQGKRIRVLRSQVTP